MVLNLTGDSSSNVTESADTPAADEGLVGQWYDLCQSTMPNYSLYLCDDETCRGQNSVNTAHSSRTSSTKCQGFLPLLLYIDGNCKLLFRSTHELTVRILLVTKQTSGVYSSSWWVIEII